MTRRLATLVVACLLLAGCSSAPDEDPAATTTLTPTPTGPTAPAADAEPAVPAPVSATCDVTRTNLGTPVGFGLYADRIVADTGCFLDELFADHAWAQSALVEVEWTPGASTTAADAWIESDECIPSPTAPCDAPRATSAASPFSVLVEGDDYAKHAPANLEVQVAGQGAAVQQAFKVTITLFANATVDAGYSALA